MIRWVIFPCRGHLEINSFSLQTVLRAIGVSGALAFVMRHVVHEGIDFALWFLWRFHRLLKADSARSNLVRRTGLVWTGEQTVHDSNMQGEHGMGGRVGFISPLDGEIHAFSFTNHCRGVLLESSIDVDVFHTGCI
jgi:hypothetical protein